MNPFSSWDARSSLVYECKLVQGQTHKGKQRPGTLGSCPGLTRPKSLFYLIYSMLQYLVIRMCHRIVFLSVTRPLDRVLTLVLLFCPRLCSHFLFCPLVSTPFLSFFFCQRILPKDEKKMLDKLQQKKVRTEVTTTYNTPTTMGYPSQ